MSVAAISLLVAGGFAVRGRSASTQSVIRDRLLLLPPIEAGQGGWCLTLTAGDCPAAKASQGPIVAETQTGQGPPSRQVGEVLTEPEVASVRVSGGRAVATRPEPQLPDVLRVAVVEVRNGASRHVNGFPGTFPVPLHFTPFDRAGHVLPRPTAHEQLAYVLPTVRWTFPARPATGICEIGAASDGDIKVVGGAVVSRFESHVSFVGRPLLACASTWYHVGGSTVLASVLVDAGRPGVEPGPLPGAASLKGHAGMFVASGASLAGIKDDGQMVARRIAGGWLIAAEGTGVAQRAAVLKAISASIRVPAGAE
jgi:hypothetical protein